MKMKKPNLFIVGPPKSGTTSLWEYLKQHPEIYMPDIKEPRFFCKDFHREEEEFYEQHKERVRSHKYFYKTLKDYLRIFQKAKSEKFIGEASPNYLYSKVAAKEIKAFNPNAKIIIILREPVHFLHSSYHQRKKSEERARNFEEALKLERERKKGNPLKITSPPISQSFYSERIKYSEQVKRYLKEFGKKNVLVLIYEDFLKNNLRTVRDIFEFLEIDPNFTRNIQIINKGKKVRFIFLKSFFDLLFMINLRRKLKKVLPSKFKNWLNKIYFKLVFMEGKEKLDLKLEKNLKKKFKSEVVKINKLLNKKGLINKNLVKFWKYEP